MTLHSICTLLSATRGGFTMSEAIGVNPDHRKFINTLWVFATGKGYLLDHGVVNDIDHYFGHFKHIFEGMFGGIIPYPAWREKRPLLVGLRKIN